MSPQPAASARAAWNASRGASPGRAIRVFARSITAWSVGCSWRARRSTARHVALKRRRAARIAVLGIDPISQEPIGISIVTQPCQYEAVSKLVEDQGTDHPAVAQLAQHPGPPSLHRPERTSSLRPQVGVEEARVEVAAAQGVWRARSRAGSVRSDQSPARTSSSSPGGASSRLPLPEPGRCSCKGQSRSST
jgi:hypothetical protein